MQIILEDMKKKVSHEGNTGSCCRYRFQKEFLSVWLLLRGISLKAEGGWMHRLL